jgi:phosphohistidine phosphatase
MHGAPKGEPRMNVLLIRHAIAENRQKFARTGEDDTARPLTARGRRRMRAAARGLRRVAPRIDVLATSPLTRALQTAEIVTAAFGGLKAVEVPQLTPDASVHALLKWLQEHKGDGTVALIGHEPQLGVFASWLLTGLQESFVEFKKGGACMLELKDQVRSGRATLLWQLRPSHLRRLGEG